MNLSDINYKQPKKIHQILESIRNKYIQSKSIYMIFLNYFYILKIG